MGADGASCLSVLSEVLNPKIDSATNLSFTGLDQFFKKFSKLPVNLMRSQIEPLTTLKALTVEYLIYQKLHSHK